MRRIVRGLVALRTHTVVHKVQTRQLATMLVRLKGPVTDAAYQAEDVAFEEPVLAYLGAGETSGAGNGTTIGAGSWLGSSGASTAPRARLHLG